MLLVELRHELKHEIAYQDMIVLRSRLKTVMNSDNYAVDGKYKIRSLYSNK